MFPNVKSVLNISKILNTISKSLNIANELIPIYENAKPLVNNLKNAFSKIPNFNINHSTNTKKEIMNNNPQFFK